MEMKEGWENWCWYLVVDEDGNVDQAFNSLIGATIWWEEHGGIIKKVMEVTAQ